MDYTQFAREEAQRQGLDPELVAGVMHQESRGDPNAVSRKGARGLMQLMPATARELKVDPTDPFDNIRGGVTYLKRQLDDFGTPDLALAAYNAGPEAVRRHRGVPPYAETQDYVRKIMGRMGGGAAAGGGQSGADIFGLGGDQGGEAVAGGAAEASGGDIFGLDGPAAGPGSAAGGLPGSAAPVASATPPALGGLEPGDGSVIDKVTGRPATAAQTATYHTMMKDGSLEPNAEWGSKAFPQLQTGPNDIPGPGKWYVDLAGAKQQAPDPNNRGTPLQNATSIANTALHGMLEAALPNTPAMQAAIGKNDRLEAIKQGGLSGMLMGGKNEILSLGEGLAGLVQGGNPAATEAFARSLAARDAEDHRLKKANPATYLTSAAAGGLAGGAVLPGVQGAGLARVGNIALQSSLGGLGGFVSTDGTTEDRLKGAGIGAVGGAALTAAAPPLAGYLRNFFPDRLSSDAGVAGDKALRALGTSMEDLPPEALAGFQRLVQMGGSPADAARIVMAQSLPTPVPLSRGQVTGLPDDQLPLNLSLRGANGPRAAEMAQNFGAEQQAALRANTDQIAGGITGRGALPRINQGGADAAEELAAQRITAKQGVDQAFDAARATNGTAVLPTYDMQALASGMMDAVEAKHAFRDVPKVAGHLRDMLILAQGDAPIRQLFEARARLSSVRADGMEEGAAAGRALRVFDATMADALAADLIHGDPAAVENWRTAIGRRREFGEIFEQGDMVDRLTERTGQGGARRLKVDPGDAANLIFGRSAMGAAGRRNLYTDLTKMRDLLGRNSEAWNALRGEHFARLVQGADGAFEAGERQFSGVNFAKAWGDTKATDMRLVQTLYSPEEIATINRFAATSARVTNPVKGGDNSSNTAVAMKALKAMGGLLGRIGKAVPVIGDTLVKQIDQAVQELATRAAMRPIPRTVTPAPTRLLPAYGGAASGAYLEHLLSGGN